MSRNVTTGPRLPRTLADQIGARGPSRKNRSQASRKDLRKQQRQARKSVHPRPESRLKDADAQKKSLSVGRVITAFSPAAASATRRKGTRDFPDEDDAVEDDRESESLDESEDEDQIPETESSPEYSSATSKPSRTIRARLEQDDDEIARLERKLGIRRRAKARTSGAAADDDGLDDLLGEIDEALGGTPSSDKRPLEDDDEWLRQKRRKLAAGPEDNYSDDGDVFEGFASSGEENVGADTYHEAPEGDGIQSSLPKSARENPYRPPTMGESQSVGASKYIPPSLRAQGGLEDGSHARLKREIQGLVNRLSESNMISILTSVNELYQSNPRGHVTDGLITTLLALLGDRAILSDTFVILHSAFITGLYHLVGLDFAAQLLEMMILGLDGSRAESDGKAESNLICVISTLYAFSFTSSVLIFDLLRHYISPLTEHSTEMLLRILRSCGPQLRSDDTCAIKDIVGIIQRETVRVGHGSLSVRQQFMIDTITDLRNGKFKSGLGASETRVEMVGRMKKLLGQIKAKSAKSGEPLRIGLDDIRQGDKKGKWWLVGASWRGQEAKHEGDRHHEDTEGVKALGNGTADPDHEFADLSTLAKQLGMNTDVRRGIFVAIMAAADHRDAVNRIIKLALKKSQLAEVALVVVKCVSAEDVYNPFYALVARELCSKREVRFAFESALWDTFTFLAEKEDDASSGQSQEDRGDRPTTAEVVHRARLFAALLGAQALPITALKRLDFAYLGSRTALFLEVMLATLILDKGHGKAAVPILARANEDESFAIGFRWWLAEVLSKTEVPEKSKHRERVRRICRKVVAELDADNIVLGGPESKDRSTSL